MDKKYIGCARETVSASELKPGNICPMGWDMRHVDHVRTFTLWGEQNIEVFWHVEDEHGERTPGSSVCTPDQTVTRLVISEEAK